MDNQKDEDEIKNKKLTQEIMAEAEEYCTLCKEYRERKWRDDEEYKYILNRKWLKKWKDYVNYAYVKRRMIYSFQYAGRILKPYEVNMDKHPGPIDNYEIILPLDDFLNDGDATDQSNLILKNEIIQRNEVKICGKKVWDFFHTRYAGGPEIIRPWITEGFSYNSKKVVELFSRVINIILLPDRRNVTKENIYSINSLSMYCSRNKNLQDIKQKFVKIFDNIKKSNKRSFDQGSIPDLYLKRDYLNVNNLRIWKINSESNLDEFKEFLLKNLDDIVNTDNQINPEQILCFLEYFPNISLKDLEFADTEIAVIEYSDDLNPTIFEVKKSEFKEGKCYWCDLVTILKFFCLCKEVGYCSSYCQSRGSKTHTSSCKKAFLIEEDSLKFTNCSMRGLTGLQNLGNTCFMNTSLQCMSNCYELTRYFIENYYKDHINTENPIGTQGILARSYSNLLKNLWYGNSNVYSPWNFKSAIERFQSMFVGYHQHDTQEFLNYLLDGLHEDLNKVIVKPIVEKDDVYKEDSIKAKEQWIGFLKRNQSFLVDLLYGQYKSTLYCPDQQCQNVSTTFDPFLSVSLPMVSSEKYEVKCFFIFYDVEIYPIQLTLNFFTETSVMALRNKLAKILNVNPYSFVIMKMNKNGELDYIVNSAWLLKTNSLKNHFKNQIPFFCFQIDPNIFYSKINNTLQDLDLKQNRDFSLLYEELTQNQDKFKFLFQEDYEEDTTGRTNEEICYYSKFNIITDGKVKPALFKINTDNNNGLISDFIKVVLNIRKYDENSTILRSKLLFPRILYINKKWTTKQLHLIISIYFFPILRKKFTIDMPNIWDNFFPDLEETLQNSPNLSYEEHRVKAFPYLIRIKNIFTEMGGHCIFCNRNICDDCLLPCRDDITIEDLLNLIPKNYDKTIDNTYYYLNERQRNICQIRETDFSLDVTWLKEYEDLVKTLNAKSDFEFESNESRYQDSISINNCFKNFVKREKLEENNEWFCPKCKNHQNADKKMEIYRSPHILIIHLKRFKNNTKIGTLVDFPIKGLNISNYVIHKEKDQNLVYDLFAIANHNGSLYGGHYYAYAKNHFENEWYSFNDSSVSRICEGQLITNSAYVLFYRRRDLHNIFDFEYFYKKPFENFETILNDHNSSLKKEIKNIEIS